MEYKKPEFSHLGFLDGCKGASAVCALMSPITQHAMPIASLMGSCIAAVLTKSGQPECERDKDRAGHNGCTVTVAGMDLQSVQWCHVTSSMPRSLTIPQLLAYRSQEASKVEPPRPKMATRGA